MDDDKNNPTGGRKSGTVDGLPGPDKPDKNPQGPGGPDPNAEKDKKENDALDNLAAIANYNGIGMQNKFNQGMDMYNTSDQMIGSLWQKQTNDNKNKIGSDWFEQLKKLQQSVTNLKNRAGSSLSGSNLYDFWDLLDSENDSIRNQSLMTQRDNQNNIDNDWFESMAQNVNARNQLAADTEYGLRNIVSDWAAQSTSVAPDKAKERGIFAPDQGAGAGTINNPAWLNPDEFYNTHKTAAIEPKQQGFYLEDNAMAKARNVQNAPTKASSSAANGTYWQDLLNGYSKRY